MHLLTGRWRKVLNSHLLSRQTFHLTQSRGCKTTQTKSTLFRSQTQEAHTTWGLFAASDSWRFYETFEGCRAPFLPFFSPPPPPYPGYFINISTSWLRRDTLWAVTLDSYFHLRQTRFTSGGNTAGCTMKKPQLYTSHAMEVSCTFFFLSSS